MPKPCGTHQQSGIPASKVDGVMQDYLFDQPISVSKQQDADGSFTVTAVFPPCTDDEVSGAADEEEPPGPAAAAPASAPPLAPNGAFRRGFDANRDCTKLVSKIVAQQVEFVGRYYSHTGPKNLTAAEAKLLSDAGVNLVAVWESAG